MPVVRRYGNMTILCKYERWVIVDQMNTVDQKGGCRSKIKNYAGNVQVMYEAEGLRCPVFDDVPDLIEYYKVEFRANLITILE